MSQWGEASGNKLAELDASSGNGPGGQLRSNLRATVSTGLSHHCSSPVSAGSTPQPPRAAERPGS